MPVLRPISPRRLAICYAIALLIIAALSTASHLLLSSAIHDNRGVAEVIRLSARQEVLAQQIAGFAAQLALGERSVQPELLQSIDAFEAGQNRLLAGGIDNTPRVALQHLYLDGSAPVAGIVAQYARDARLYATLPPGDPRAARLLDGLLARSRTTLPQALESIVLFHQQESEHRLGGLKHLNRHIIIVAIASGLAVGALFLVSQAQIRRMSEQQYRLSALVANSNDAIIGLALNGLVLDWNPAAAAMFGYPAERAVGQTLFDLTTIPEYRQEEIQLLSRVARGETVPHFHTRRRHADGHLVDVSITLSPLRSAEGRVVGICMSVHDISDLRATEAALRDLRNKVDTIT